MSQSRRDQSSEPFDHVRVLEPSPRYNPLMHGVSTDTGPGAYVLWADDTVGQTWPAPCTR